MEDSVGDDDEGRNRVLVAEGNYIFNFERFRARGLSPYSMDDDLYIIRTRRVGKPVD